MIYYSTGKSPHLAIKGKPVDCSEQTGEHLVERGLMVRNLSELEAQETKPIEVQKPIGLEERETKPLVKRKGNPNWAKKN